MGAERGGRAGESGCRRRELAGTKWMPCQKVNEQKDNVFFSSVVVAAAAAAAAEVTTQPSPRCTGRRGSGRAEVFTFNLKLINGATVGAGGAYNGGDFLSRPTFQEDRPFKRR